ncbi:MAG: hypothetical protein ACK2UQ_05185, partial [Anaerolineae bacterium]
ADADASAGACALYENQQEAPSQDHFAMVNSRRLSELYNRTLESAKLHRTNRLLFALVLIKTCAILDIHTDN